MKVVDRQGKEVEIDDKDVQAAILSGHYGLPQGTRLPVKTATGKYGTVPVESLRQATEAGARVITPDELEQHKYGSGADAVLAGVEGAAQGATFDMATPALVHAAHAVSPEFSEKLAHGIAARAKANPTAHMFGEGAGMLGLGLATGGLGEGAEAASALEAAPEAIDAARVAAASGAASPYRSVAPEIASALSAGTPAIDANLASGLTAHAVQNAAQEQVAANLGSTGQSLLAKLLTHTAEGAAFGGVQGAGDALTEDSLSPSHDLTAQKFLTQMGEGALFGAAGGAALGTAMEGAKGALGKLAPGASRLAEEQAYRALFAGADQKSIEEAARIPGGPHAIARRLLDEGAIQAGDKWSDVMPRVEKLEEAAADQVHQFRTVLDKAGAEGPKTAAILDSFEGKHWDEAANEFVSDKDGLLAKFEQAPALFKGPMALMRTLSETIASKGDSMTFQEAQDLRRTIDNQITSWKKAIGSPERLDNMAVLKEARRAIESEVEKAGDAAAKKMGGSFLEPYKEAKTAYRQMRTALDTLERSELKSSNRNFSLSDYQASHIGGLSGLAAQGITHGASYLLDAHVPGLSLATAVAHRAIRERGNATAAILLDKMAALGGIQEAVRRNEREVGRGISQLVTPGKRVAPTLRLSKSTTEQRMRWVQQHLQGIEPASHVAEPLATHAPNVSKAITRTGSRAVAYLANLMPKPNIGSPLDPEPKRLKPQDRVQAAKFNRAYDAITQGAPLLLQHVNDGTLTRDEVEAFEAVHGDDYADLQARIVRDVISAGKELPFKTKVQLSILLGQSVTPLMAQPYIDAALKSPPAGPQSGGPAGGNHATHSSSATRIKPPKDIAKATMLTGLTKETFLP